MDTKIYGHEDKPYLKFSNLSGLNTKMRHSGYHVHEWGQWQSAITIWLFEWSDLSKISDWK